jgi:hypothetical protein
MLQFQLQPGRSPRSLAIAERMRAPLPASVSLGLAGVMRQGPGSTGDQFARQAEMGARASIFWKRTLPFGNRPAPARTLHRTGGLQAAWTGTGPGAVTETRHNGVRIGVDRVRFPQARMFQRSGVTPIRVTPKSRVYLGMEFGVWLRKDRTHLYVEGRPLSVNTLMLDRARKVVLGYFLKGEAAAVARAA